jgi:hypothetical protein
MGRLQKGVRPMTRLRGTAEEDAARLRSYRGGEHVRSVYAPEPPRWSIRGPAAEVLGEYRRKRSMEVLWETFACG